MSLRFSSLVDYPCTEIQRYPTNSMSWSRCAFETLTVSWTFVNSAAPLLAIVAVSLPTSRTTFHPASSLLTGKHHHTGFCAALWRVILSDFSSIRLLFVFVFYFMASHRANFSFNSRMSLAPYSIILSVSSSRIPSMIYFITTELSTFTCLGMSNYWYVCVLGSMRQSLMHLVRVYFLRKFGTQHFLRYFATFKAHFIVNE